MGQPFVHKSPIPGLGLSAGITLSMLSVMVLLPIAALLVQGFSAGVPAFLAAVNTPRTWAALFLSFRLSLVAALFTLVHMLREGQYSVALLPAALVGTLLGFLLFNFQPARLFLGGGSLFLGFALAGIGIIAGAKIALLMLVVGLPVADVAWQIFDRARRGRSPAQADRGHLHLRLVDLGWSPRRICTVYVIVCTLLGAAALAAQPPLYKLLTLAALFATVIAVLIGLSARTSAQEPVARAEAEADDNHTFDASAPL